MNTFLNNFWMWFALLAWGGLMIAAGWPAVRVWLKFDKYEDQGDL